MKVGETITKTIKCVEGTDMCEGCMFDGIDDCDNLRPDYCSGIVREDGKEVIFIEVK